MSYKDKKVQREYQLKWIQNRRTEWIDSKGGRCKQCKSIKDLEIDHINRRFKSADVNYLWSRKLEVRGKELKKCQVLCRKCHRKKTDKENLALNK